MNLSKESLRNELKKRGVNVGPVTDTTRKVYEAKLLSLLKEPTLPLHTENSVKGVSLTSAASLPIVMNLSQETLRNELKKRGVNVGPVTDTTRKVYEAKLLKLLKEPTFPLQAENSVREHCSVLERALENMETVCPYAALEQTVSQQFSAPGPGLWWEGSSNTRCNYLLLDPRRLPRDDEPLDARRRWAAFLDAIFYIGQGRSFRQHAHMLEAASALRERARSRSGKVKMILDIWEEGQGVVSYLVFCNIVQEEARTREAAMIDALGIDFLTNERKGSYHGVAREWSQKQKQQLGTYLLYKAFHQFRSERAHHIRPCDLGIWCGK